MRNVILGHFDPTEKLIKVKKINNNISTISFGLSHIFLVCDAVINYHKLVGFKQRKFRTERLEVQNQFHWANFRCQ